MEPFLGEIKMVGFNFAPQGYAFCNGAIVSIAQNTALFSLLGTTFGGDGQSTFGLPDFRGRRAVGMGAGPGLAPVNQGEMAGTPSATVTLAQLPMHNHTASYANPQVALSGTLSIPATTTQGSGSETPANNLILGPSNDPTAGAEVKVYSSATANTSLATISLAATGAMPGPTLGNTGGTAPVSLVNPRLGTSFIIAMEGVFPSHS